MRLVPLVAAAALGACGESIVVDDVPLPQAQTLIIVAHFDDDEIFMQPELVDAVNSGSLTTVYVTSGDPNGLDEELRVFGAAMIAYGEVARASDWQCGYTMIAGFPARHCRLPDRGISLVALDVPDGGIDGADHDSLLHLLDGTVSSLPVIGPIGGYAVTQASLVDEVATIITATSPAQIHTLDVAGISGEDHSSHLLAAGFALWAAARTGFAGELRSHRGYNTEVEPPTLTGADYSRAEDMLGYFDACYLHCGPCGDSCVYVDPHHQSWLQRQYFTTRTPQAAGALALTDEPSLCVMTSATSLVVGTCDFATTLSLDATGHLHVGDACLATNDDDTLELAACEDTPAQYWLFDSEGSLWNGLPVSGSRVTTYDHARCLHVDEATAGATISAPICGGNRHTSWQMLER